MADQERKALIRVFLQEATDWIESLDRWLLEMEDEPGATEPVTQFMRAAHTLKGSAGIVGLSSVGEVAHALESVVERIRDGHLRASPEVFDSLSRALEGLSKSRERLAAGVEKPTELLVASQDLTKWFDQQSTQRAEKARAKGPRSELTIGEYDQVRLEVLHEQGKQLLQVAVEMGEEEDPGRWGGRIVARLRKVGAVVTTGPKLAQLGELKPGQRLLVVLGTDVGAEVVQEHLTAADVACQVEEFSWEYRVQEADLKTQQLSGALVSERTLRVELRTLDELLRLVGELMLCRDRYTQLRKDIADELQDDTLAGQIGVSAGQLGRLTSDLQDAIMRARMVPVTRIFRIIKRRLRSMAREQSATLQLKAEGGFTELDKNLVDTLAEPIAAFAAHLLETSAAGAAAQELTFSVEAHRRYNQVQLVLSAAGAVPQDQQLSRLEELLVRSGGRLEHRVADGRHEVILSLPLTLAIIRVLMVMVGNEAYAVPIETVQEVFELRTTDIWSIRGTRVADLRGLPLSLMFLNELFDVPRSGQPELYRIVVLRHERAPIGLVVDELVGIREVVIKPFRSRFLKIPAINGSAILGKGQIALILSTEALIELALRAARQQRKLPKAMGAVA